LIVHEAMLDKLSQFFVSHDLFPDLPSVPHTDVAEMLCIFGVVGPLLSFLAQLIP
jgi:hypothetical protein